LYIKSREAFISVMLKYAVARRSRRSHVCSLSVTR